MKLKRQFDKKNQNTIKKDSAVNPYFVDVSNYKKKPLSKEASLIAVDTVSSADLLMAKGHSKRLYAILADTKLIQG